MNRREFLKTTAGIGAGLVVAPSVVTAQDAAASSSRIVVDGLDTSIVSAEFLGLLRQGGVDCMHGSLGTVDHYGYMYGFADEHPDEAVIAKSVADIRQAKRDGKISFIFGAQHANHLEELVDKDPKGTFAPVKFALRGYKELGLRFQGICYNVTNIFGGGNLDPRVPLTRAGRLLVEEIHNLSLILDVGGHTGEQTSLDAIAMSSGVPVVCTHTNAAALIPNIRAISDRLAEAIAGTGGVIGVTAISDFQMRSADNYEAHGATSPQATLDDHLDQYDHFKKLVGADHIGLGPDFVWGWGETFYHAPDDSITFPPESLGLGVPKLVKGFEDISKLPNLIKGLQGRGWTGTELDKLLGANWMRVYERVWGR